MLSLKNIIITTLLILACGLSSWSIYHSQKDKPKVIVADTMPDSFMENVTATIINKDGKPSLVIKSPKLVHYPKDDTVDITSPEITLYRDTPEPWHIKSNHAKATDGINKIFFWSNVIINHNKDKSAPITTFTTDTLTVFPMEYIAKTDDNITLKQPETTVHAKGMTANWSNGEIKLLSSARGEYDPQ